MKKHSVETDTWLLRLKIKQDDEKERLRKEEAKVMTLQKCKVLLKSHIAS